MTPPRFWKNIRYFIINGELVKVIKVEGSNTDFP
jgi:hypothetical protein